MQNIVVDLCEKCHNDRLRNDGALVHWKSDNNHKKHNNKNNVGSVWGPVSGSNEINNSKDNIYCTVIVAQPLRDFTSINWMKNSSQSNCQALH